MLFVSLKQYDIWFLHKVFPKIRLDHQLQTKSLILEHLEKSWENIQNKIAMQILTTNKMK